MDRSSVVNAPATNQTLDAMEASQPFVGRWNRLVSQTNWEKGKILIQWRDALVAAGADPATTTDEAWSEQVGGVSAQHVGRLRRVSQRFDAVHDSYAGLFWSHFCAALDWHDAEMWLEGAVQNDWSVSQMRDARWRASGAVADEQPRGKLESEEASEGAPSDDPRESDDTLSASRAQVQPHDRDAADEDPADAANNALAEFDGSVDPNWPVEGARSDADLVAPFENLPELPDDLAEALDSFKIALLRHKLDDWQEVTPQTVLAVLDGLKQLVSSPNDG